jgi:hypothetical protein
MGQAQEVRELTRELMDLSYRRPLTPRLLPWANLSLLGAAGYGLAWLVSWAFREGFWLGVVHLFVVAPLGLLAAAVLARVLLELSLSMHEIRTHVVELGELPRRVGSWPALQKLAALGERSGFTAATKPESRGLR